MNTYNLFRATRDWKQAECKLSQELQDVVFNFSRTGNPDTVVVRFKRFDPVDPYRAVLRVPLPLQKLNARGPRIASPRLLLGVTVASSGMLPAAFDRIAFPRWQTAIRFVECKRWKCGPEAKFGNISDDALGNRIT